MKVYNIYNKVRLGVAALTLLAVTSCGEDFLDRTPLHGYTAPTYFTSDEAIIKATEPLYNYAWHGYNERAIVGMGSFRANDAWSPYLQGEFARFTIRQPRLTPIMMIVTSPIARYFPAFFSAFARSAAP